VVNTMPEATIHAFADHGETKTGVVPASYATARQVLADLAGLGIAYDDVTATLEREGVEKFEASWTELLASVQTQLEVSRA
jgi:transaldolase